MAFSPGFRALVKIAERSKICEVDLSCSFSTYYVLMKSRPSTVGVPAWAKAAKKRQAQVFLLDKKKTARQMLAELRLADDDSNKSDFLTTTRVGVHRPKSNPAPCQMNKCRMAATSKQEMYIFYHPIHDYPVQNTQAVKANDWMIAENSTMDDYRDDLTESQVAEIRSLRKKDPKLWSVDVLSHMYEVKPLAIIKAAPLTPEQQLELEVEQEFQSRLSDYEKQEYADFKNLERRKQLRRRSRRTEVA